MKREEKYNGWSNWSTWNANLHLTNTEELYKVLLTCKTDEDCWELYTAVFGHDHDNIDVSKINWQEILEGIK